MAKTKKPKFTMVETFAYYMGQVERGRKNPDSRITESYNNGSKVKDKKKKKSLF